MYTSIVGNFGSGTAVSMVSVRSSTTVAVRLTVVAKWFVHS